MLLIVLHVFSLAHRRLIATRLLGCKSDLTPCNLFPSKHASGLFLPMCLICANRNGEVTWRACSLTPSLSSTPWQASSRLDLQLCIPLLGLAWELPLLFDLVCFGLLIKHVFCFVGGASQSGAEWFTPPPLFIPLPQVCSKQILSHRSRKTH